MSMLQFSKYAQSTLSWKDKFSTLSANIIFLGWNPGCCWQVPSCLHGGSLCWTGLQKPTYLSSLILLVILGISCRQLVASLQAGRTWWCWQWGLRPRMLHSSALLSGDASSYLQLAIFLVEKHELPDKGKPSSAKSDDFLHIV